MLRNVSPAIVVVLVLVADTVAAVTAALFYSLLTVVLLGLTAGVCQALGKLSLDSLIQGNVGDRTRSSAFARSETLLQLSWVAGGFLGIALPLIPRVGLGRRRGSAGRDHRLGRDDGAPGDRRRPDGSGQRVEASSSSASARSSIAVGLTCLGSGCRPAR